MAAPTVRAFGTATNGTDAAPAFAVSQPAGVATGDLLLAFAVCDTTGTAWTASPGNGWVQLSDEVQGATHRLAVYAVIADGTDTLSIASANNQDYSCVMMAVTTGTHSVTNVSTDIVIPAAATASTGNANPPASGTVTSRDWLAIAACGVDLTASGDSVSAAPTNYTTGAVLTKSASSATSVGLGVGHRALTAATSEDPGTFTNTSQAWIAKTLLIPPFNPNATATPATIARAFTLPAPSATGGGGGGGVLASDDFTRANTTTIAASGAGLGANWTDTESGGQHYINTNRMTQTSGDHWCKHVTTMGGPDHYVEADIQGGATDNFVLVNARGPASTLANCYMLLANGSTLELASQVGGTYTPLDTATITMGANQTGRLRLECEGTTIRGYWNDVLEITVTGNSDVTTGNFVGINAFATDADEVFIDNFEAGTLGAGGTDGTATPAVIASSATLPAPSASGTYPVIATTSTEADTSMGTQAITAPAGVVTGNLLLAFSAIDNTGTTVTASTGWTTVVTENSTSVIRIAVHARIADGSGDDALTLTGATEDYCASILRIAQHGVASNATITSEIKATGTNSGAGFANPPDLDAADSRAWLWLAAAAVDLTTGESITAMPASYTEAHTALKSADSTTSCALGVAYRTVTAQSENPGAFTHPSQEYAAVTVAVPPAGSATRAPATIARSVTIPDATASGPATVTPALIASSTTIPAATPQAGSSLAPAVIARSALIPGASATGGGAATATPAVIARTTVIPAPAPEAGSTLAPAVIARVAALPAPSATGGGGGGGGGTVGYYNGGTQGANTATTAQNWDVEAAVGAGMRYTAVSGDTVTQVAVYGANDGVARVAIYTYVGGVPVTKVGSDVTVTISTGAAWYTAATSIALTNGVEYVAAISYTTGVDATWDIRYDTIGGTQTSVHSAVSLPSTWTQASTHGDATSFYATVTGSGGGGGGTATPAVIGRSATLPAPSATGGGAGTGSPAIIARAALLPAPSATGSGNGTGAPAIIARSVTLPAPSTGGGGGGATMGYDNGGAPAGSTDTTGDNWLNEALVGAAQRYTATTGDTVTSVSVWGGGDGVAEVGVYTYSGGVPVTKVNSTTIAVGTAVQEWSTDVSWALTNGVVYVVAIDWTSGLGAYWDIRYDDPGLGAVNTSVGNVDTALPGTWTQTTTTSGLGQFWATVNGGGGGTDGTATPATIAAVVDIADVAGIDATIAPTAITRSAVIPQATASGSTAGTGTPAVIARSATLPAPVANAGTVRTVAIIARVALLPAPTASGSTSGTATPATIARVAVIPQATASGVSSGTATPAVIARTVTLPAPNKVFGFIKTVTKITVAVTIPTPQAGSVFFINITFTALAPVFARPPELDSEFYSREPGDPEFYSREPGDPTTAHEAGDPEFYDRDPGDPTFTDRDTTTTFLPRTPGEPTL